MNDQQEHIRRKRKRERERVRVSTSASMCVRLIEATIRYALCIRSARFSRTLSLLMLLQKNNTESYAWPICVLHHFNEPAIAWFAYSVGLSVCSKAYGSA